MIDVRLGDPRLGEGPLRSSRGKLAVRVVEVKQGQAELLELVLSLDTVRGFAHLLHGRQQEANEDGDDRDDHQQFDQRKGSTSG